MQEQASKPREPLCPRCGYDQSGAIKTWGAESCPLGGLCTECGLEFEWRRVLGADVHRSSFEHAQTRLVRAWFTTLWKVWRPRRMWRWLGMEDVVVPGRLVRFGATGFVGMWALIFGLTWVYILIERERAYANAPWMSMRMPFAKSALEEWVVDPLSIAAERLALDLFSPVVTAIMGSGGGVVDPWPLASLVAMLLLPATFLLLPQSLRRAKVRRAHLFRLACYFVVLLPALVSTWPLSAVLSSWVCDWIAGGPDYWETRRHFTSIRLGGYVGITCLYCWWWWSCAIGLYLRLPRAHLVALVMLVIAWLVALLAVCVLPGGAHGLVYKYFV